MIQTGALEIRSFKKLFYLKTINLIGLFNKVIWHATDNQEKIDIEKLFGENSNVIMAPNIPKKPLRIIKPIKKETNYLKLVFLSLITEKKNLGLIIKGFKEIKLNIVFDIYGPIKDKIYWLNCLNLISQLPRNIQVNYLGDIKPDLVQSTIQNYHALILPSKGENFGHSIYESLSVGRPVIISEFTPWGHLNEKMAGWNTKLNEKSIYDAILDLNSLDEKKYNLYCENAFRLAKKYYSESIQIEAYEKLFH